MKTLASIVVAAIAVAALSCSSGSSGQTAGADSTSQAPAESAPKADQINIVIWNEVGVKATPEEKGKYVTSIYLGEHFQLAGDTASEVSGSKRNHYHKVILSDGNSGWVRDEFVALNVQPAAIMSEAAIYKRPDIATITDKAFAMSDYVVVRKTEGGFVEVTGKLQGEKWFTTGFIQTSSISYADLEVQYAALKRRAGEETKEKVKSALMTQLANDQVFGSSVLWNADYAVEYEEEPSGDEPDTTSVDGDSN